MSVYADILSWSLTRPDWQRDALRRLFLNPQLEPNDIEELLQICKAEHGLLDHNVSHEPLASHHFQEPDSSLPPVSLTSISNVQNINALAPGQTLSFSPEGITVIFGNNASGKSGYIRLLKKVCRSRHTQEQILSNIFVSVAGEEKIATITYQVGDDEKQFDWCEDVSCPDELAAINVFDSHGASIYVNEENAVAYAPLGLNLLDSLAQVCDNITDLLNNEKRALVKALLSLQTEFQSTDVGRWYNGLTRLTQTSEITRNTTFTEEERQRSQELDRVLAQSNPVEAANELKQKATRFTRLRNNLSIINDALSDESTNKARLIKAEHDASVEAAQIASKSMEGKDPINGVGTEAWKQLWAAAKNFAESVVQPGVEFPAIDTLTYCLLCQQPLDTDAKDRLDRFDKFIRDETAKKLDECKQAIEESITKLDELLPLSEDNLETLAEFKNYSNEPGITVEDFLEKSAVRRVWLIQGLKDNKWDQPSALAVSPIDSIDKILKAIEQEVETLEKSADPVQVHNLKDEKTNLQSKEWISAQQTQILAEVERLGKVYKLDNAISSARTTSITVLSNSLTEQCVTSELKTRFDSLLKKIQNRETVLTLNKTRGQRGVVYHRVEFADEDCSFIDVHKIVSEGEFRAAALAAFLAEISMSPSRSAIVFDDPVCSFDHLHRENLAGLLVRMARSRPIIVFTHDLFFLVCLQEASKARVLFDSKEVIKQATVCGKCIPDVPWETKNLNARIRSLRNSLQEARRIDIADNRDSYEANLAQLCLRIRQATERAVEEVLTSNVVNRFRRSIQTQQISGLSVITAEDCELIEELMTKYSTQLHDQTPETRAEPPSFDEIEADLDKLNGWASEFRGRL